MAITKIWLDESSDCNCKNNCKELEEIMNEQQARENAEHERLNDMYTYTDDGFCDGFTKY